MKFLIKILMTCSLFFFSPAGRADDQPGSILLHPDADDECDKDSRICYPWIFDTVRSNLERLQKIDPETVKKIIISPDSPITRVYAEHHLSYFTVGVSRLREYSQILTEDQFNQKGLFIRDPRINSTSVRDLLKQSEEWLKLHPISAERMEELKEIRKKRFIAFREIEKARSRSFENQTRVEESKTEEEIEKEKSEKKKKDDEVIDDLLKTLEPSTKSTIERVGDAIKKSIAP